MKSFIAKVIEAGRRGNATSALHQCYTGRSGNNPADLGQIEAKFLGELSSIERGCGDDDLVLLTGSHCLCRRNSIEPRYALGVELDRHLAGGSNVAEVGGQSVGDVD